MNNLNYKNTGNFIRSLRNERGITIEKLAKYIGVTKSAVSQWESGKGIKPEMLYSLSRFFDISVDELIDGKRNDESNGDFFKRNYDLSLCDFSEEKCDDKSGEEYLSRLKQVESRFFDLLKEWTLDRLNTNAKEEFIFLSQYFERDDNYLSYLKYGVGHIGFFSDEDVKEIIRQRIAELSADGEREVQWELIKFYYVKKEWMKSDLVCSAKSDYLLGKLLLAMSQPEKDILLAINLRREETNIQSTGLSKREVKTKRDITLDEIERTSYFKTMLNAGCNIMKQYKLPSCLEKEDLDRLEGEKTEPIKEISLNDDARPYMHDAGGQGLVGSLQYWKMYSYEQYQSFVDKRTTDYCKALVNFKENRPSKYYEALKKYCMGEQIDNFKSKRHIP